MQMQHSKSKAAISSTSLGRRDFIVASVAATFGFGEVAAAATAGPDDNFEHIKWLLDEREEALVNHLDAIRRFEMIEALHGRPAYKPSVDLHSLFGQAHLSRYYPTFNNVTFSSFDGIHHFYEGQICQAKNQDAVFPGAGGTAEWTRVKAVDYHKAISNLQKKIQARQLWEAETGYIKAEAEVDRCLEALCEIERKILEIPCLSLRDIRLKIDTVDRWHADVDALWSVLASMREFVGRGAAGGNDVAQA